MQKSNCKKGQKVGIFFIEQRLLDAKKYSKEGAKGRLFFDGATSA